MVPSAKSIQSIQSITSIRSNQLGASLVEVMIAIVIASFALLGLAGLQVSALRYQKVANYHSQASQFAAEMADRMRANTEGARLGAYSVPAGSYSSAPPTIQNAAACTDDRSCARANSAVQDIFNWRRNLNANMAGGWGLVRGDVANGFTIQVYYREGAVEGAAQAALPPDPRCTAAQAGDTNVRCFTTVFFP